MIEFPEFFSIFGFIYFMIYCIASHTDR